MLSSKINFYNSQTKQVATDDTTRIDMREKSIQMTLFQHFSGFEEFILIVEITTETKAILFKLSLILVALCKLRYRALRSY